MVDLTPKSVSSGKRITVFVDCNVMNVDGNLFDATDAVRLCPEAKMKKYVVKDEKVEAKDEWVPVHRQDPRPGEDRDKMIVDPYTEEEAAMDMRITITTDDEGSVCASQKVKGRGQQDVTMAQEEGCRHVAQSGERNQAPDTRGDEIVPKAKENVRGLGAKYGGTLRKRVVPVSSGRSSRPGSAPRARAWLSRTSSGIWKCSPCGYTVAGGAFDLAQAKA